MSYHCRSSVYKVIDINDKKNMKSKFCLKLQNLPGTALAAEAENLRYFSTTNFLCFGRLVKLGDFEKWKYFLNDAFGPDFNALVKTYKRLRMRSAMHLAIESLKAVAIHDRGYCHRDIRAGHFCIGASAPKWRTAYVISFRHAIQIMDANGKVLIARQEKIEFSGDFLYASHHIHNGRDMRKIEDLFAWFFMRVELVTGELPWSRQVLTTKGTPWLERMQEIGRIKTESYESPQMKLLEKCPTQLNVIFNEITSYAPDEPIRYDNIFSLLLKVETQYRADDHDGDGDALDW